MKGIKNLINGEEREQEKRRMKRPQDSFNHGSRDVAWISSIYSPGPPLLSPPAPPFFVVVVVVFRRHHRLL